MLNPHPLPQFIYPPLIRNRPIWIRCLVFRLCLHLRKSRHSITAADVGSSDPKPLRPMGRSRMWRHTRLGKKIATSGCFPHLCCSWRSPSDSPHRLHGDPYCQPRISQVSSLLSRPAFRSCEQDGDAHCNCWPALNPCQWSLRQMFKGINTGEEDTCVANTTDIDTGYNCYSNEVSGQSKGFAQLP